MSTDFTTQACPDKELRLNFDGHPDPAFTDCMSIYYHLHLANELVAWVQRALDTNDISHFTGNTFRKLEGHVAILEGTHPQQKQHIPKPEHWRPDQVERL